MDVERAGQILQEFIDGAELRSTTTAFGQNVPSRETLASDRELFEMAPAVEQILDQVIPGWKQDMRVYPMSRWKGRREMAVEAKSMIEHGSDIHNIPDN
jgi:hypothetical protein